MVSQVDSIHKNHPAPDFYNCEPEVDLNVVADFSTVHKKYIITTITMVKWPALLKIQLTAPGICHIHLQLGQQWNHTNHYGCANRRALQSEHSIDGNFPSGNQHQEVENPNLAFNHQVTAPINQFGPVASEASLLALVMVEQLIIQAAISSVEMFNGTKSKIESWIVSVGNAVQISEYGILWITFSKLIGSPLTLALRLSDSLPHLLWKDLKINFWDNTVQHLLTVMPSKL